MPTDLSSNSSGSISSALKLPIASVEDDSSFLASSKSDDSMSQDRSSQNYMPLLSSTSADEPNCPSTSTDASVQHHEDTIQSSSGEDQDVQQHSEEQITKSTSSLYKLVFDNIDKSVKPRYMRSNVQTKSLHYVHMYCVKDRIDFSGLSQVPKSIDIDDSLYSILPRNKILLFSLQELYMNIYIFSENTSKD